MHVRYQAALRPDIFLVFYSFYMINAWVAHPMLFSRTPSMAREKSSLRILLRRSAGKCYAFSIPLRRALPGCATPRHILGILLFLHDQCMGCTPHAFFSHAFHGARKKQPAHPASALSGKMLCIFYSASPCATRLRYAPTEIYFTVYVVYEQSLVS